MHPTVETVPEDTENKRGRERRDGRRERIRQR